MTRAPFASCASVERTSAGLCEAIAAKLRSSLVGVARYDFFHGDDDAFQHAPGGRLPSVANVEDYATRAGFGVSRVQSLRPHYAKTLDLWAASLQEHRDEAIAIQSEEVYDRYMRYLTGCADLFRAGNTDVCQFTLTKG
jgi:Mycolic acid cyclopropane synthetase